MKVFYVFLISVLVCAGFAISCSQRQDFVKDSDFVVCGFYGKDAKIDTVEVFNEETRKFETKIMEHPEEYRVRLTNGKTIKYVRVDKSTFERLKKKYKNLP